MLGNILAIIFFTLCLLAPFIFCLLVHKLCKCHDNLSEYISAIVISTLTLFIPGNNEIIIQISMSEPLHDLSFRYILGLSIFWVGMFIFFLGLVRIQHQLFNIMIHWIKKKRAPKENPLS
jgi:hypothetical protein